MMKHKHVHITFHIFPTGYSLVPRLYPEKFLQDILIKILKKCFLGTNKSADHEQVIVWNYKSEVNNYRGSIHSCLDWRVIIMHEVKP